MDEGMAVERPAAAAGEPGPRAFCGSVTRSALPIVVWLAVRDGFRPRFIVSA